MDEKLSASKGAAPLTHELEVFKNRSFVFKQNLKF